MKKLIKYIQQTPCSTPTVLFHTIFVRCIGVLLIMVVTIINGQENGSNKENQEYHIEKPGTITFTVGVKISGKVEKPQVMIFLPKEKPIYKDNSFDRSFSAEINEPLPFTPLVE